MENHRDQGAHQSEREMGPAWLFMPTEAATALASWPGPSDFGRQRSHRPSIGLDRPGYPTAPMLSIQTARSIGGSIQAVNADRNSSADPFADPLADRWHPIPSEWRSAVDHAVGPSVGLLPLPPGPAPSLQFSISHISASSSLHLIRSYFWYLTLYPQPIIHVHVWST